MIDLSTNVKTLSVTARFCRAAKNEHAPEIDSSARLGQGWRCGYGFLFFFGPIGGGAISFSARCVALRSASGPTGAPVAVFIQMSGATLPVFAIRSNS